MSGLPTRGSSDDGFVVVDVIITQSVVVIGDMVVVDVGIGWVPTTFTY